MIQISHGSILKAISLGLWPHHFGIFLGFSPDGTGWVVHTRAEEGVVVTTLEEFCRGRQFEVVDIPNSFEHGGIVVERARSQVGQPFSLFSGNCEHFVSWAFYGTAVSPQLKDYAIGAGLAALACCVLNSVGERGAL